MRNWKFHLKVVAAITVAVLAVFYIGGYFNPPAAPEENSTASPYRIIIDEASWGLNCSNAVNLERIGLEKKMKRATGENYESLKARFDELPAMPERNNAINQISTLCDGKTLCELNLADKNQIDLNSLHNCTYMLDITYRCFTLDKLRYASVENYKTGELSCENL